MTFRISAPMIKNNMIKQNSKKFKFLIVTEGSEGDNRPPIAVGNYLKTLGHDISALVPGDFVGFYNKNGIAAHPMGDSSRDFFRLNSQTMYDRNIAGFKTMFSLYSDVARLQFEMMLKHAKTADAIIASGFIFAAPTIAEYFQIPMIHTVHAPVYFPSRFVPPANVRSQHLPKWCNNLAWTLFITILDLVSLPIIKKYRKQLGLKSIASVKDYLLQNMVLAMDHPLAIPGSDSLKNGVLQTAYPGFAEHGTIDPGLRQFIQKGTPPVYFGFGSMLDASDGTTCALINRVVEKTGYRAVVLAEWLGLPPNTRINNKMFAAGFCPHKQLFPQMAAIVHHGGAGTVHSASAAGVPQVIIPHLLDQYYLSEQIHVLGCGPKPVPRKKLTEKKLVATVSDAVQNPLYRKTAQRIAIEINTRNGAKEVAEMILSRITQKQ